MMDAAVSKSKTRVRDLTHGNIWKQLFFFALPLILTNFLQQLYNTADTAIIGQAAGSKSLAAVGTCGNLTATFVYFFIGFSVGASILISNAFGARDEKMVSRLVHTTAGISLFSGIVLTLAGLFLAPLILSGMNVPEDVFPMAVLYIRLYFLGMIPTMIYNMGSGILRAVGDTQTGLYALIVSAIVNVGLDCLFIIVLRWDVAGAALGTVFAQCVSAIIIARKLISSEEIYKLNVRNIRLESILVKRIVKIGLPTGIQATLVCIANIVVQVYINGFGLQTMNGYTSYVKLDAFLYMFTEAINLSLSNFVGQNVGAKQQGRVKKSIICGWVILCSMCYALACIYMWKSGLFLGIFSSDEATIACGRTMMFIQAPLYVFYATNQVFSGVIRGLGKAHVPMFMNLFCMCCARILFISVVLQYFFDVKIVFWSYPLTWALTTVAYLLFFLIRKPIRSAFAAVENS